MLIITTKADLRHHVEDAFDSTPPSDTVIDSITDELWAEGHEQGYRSGHDWEDYLETVDLIGLATDKIEEEARMNREQAEHRALELSRQFPERTVVALRNTDGNYQAAASDLDQEDGAEIVAWFEDGEQVARQ